MKRIGILTFHGSHNNGSVLQALALQIILQERTDRRVEIVDFSNVAQKNMYAVLPKADRFRRVIKNMIWMTNYIQLKKQYQSYLAFQKQYFSLSEQHYETAGDMKDLEERYQALIVGSDQVWNVCCQDADDVYYLNFTNEIPKYAYAVSFGGGNPFERDDERGLHAGYVSQFRRISVREQNAKKWIAQATGIEVPICFDPTMLFDKAKWERIIAVGSQPLIDGKYIFYYCFSISLEIQNLLQWISGKLNLPVYFMDAKEWTLKCLWRKGIRLIKEYGPDVYMNVVKYAELLITTSFHGTAFGVIYRKNFWYINEGHDTLDKDDRAVSFLTQLSLMNRYQTISQLKSIDLTVLPDYSETEKQVDRIRKESYEYIGLIMREIDK